MAQSWHSRRVVRIGEQDSVVLDGDAVKVERFPPVLDVVQDGHSVTRAGHPDLFGQHAGQWNKLVLVI